MSNELQISNGEHICVFSLICLYLKYNFDYGMIFLANLGVDIDRVVRSFVYIASENCSKYSLLFLNKKIWKNTYRVLIALYAKDSYRKID